MMISDERRSREVVMMDRAQKAWLPVLVGGSLGLIIVLFSFMMRWSLVVLLGLSAVFLVWTWLRQPSLVRWRSAAVCLLAALVACVPADVRLRKTGRPSIAVRPILWGLPTRETMERIEPDSVVFGGCIVPPNPAHYAVLISW